MAVTAYWYGNALKLALQKEIDWDFDEHRLMLTTSSYTPDQDAHDYKSDVTNEVSGTGYTAAGQTLTSVTIIYTGGTNVIKLDAADVTWGSSTITARRAVLYNNTGSLPLVCYVDFGEDMSSSNGNFTVQWHADGIATITVTAP